MIIAKIVAKVKFNNFIQKNEIVIKYFLFKEARKKKKHKTDELN